MMIRILTATVLAVLVSGPARAENEVVLHCNGNYELPTRGTSSYMSETIYIAVDGSWVGTGGDLPFHQISATNGVWQYKDQPSLNRSKLPPREVKIRFEPKSMRIQWLSEELGELTVFRGSCFPIENPFLKRSR